MRWVGEVALCLELRCIQRIYTGKTDGTYGLGHPHVEMRAKLKRKLNRI